jgi:Tfp pilus assembly protein PilX
MSDIDYFDEDSEPVESKPNPVRQRMKQLEKEAEELRKQVAEAAAARRELAFVKAGIDPSNPMAKYFVKGYDGELDPEAIKQAAMEAQLISPPQPVVNTEADAWQRTNSVAAGSQTAQPPVDWARRIAEASSPAEVEAIMAEARTQL